MQRRDHIFRDMKRWVVALLLVSACVAELQVVRVEERPALNESVPLKRDTVMLFEHAGSPLRSPWHVLTLSAISNIFTTASLRFNASLCSVRLFEHATCDAVLKHVEGSRSAGGVLGTVGAWVAGSWHSDVIDVKLSPYTPACVGLLSNARCDLAVSIRTVGMWQRLGEMNCCFLLSFC